MTPIIHPIVRTIEAYAHWRQAKGVGTVAFVPTMGALHAGHLALIQRAKQLADHVVVSIFVNPTQFGPGEDLQRYPRTLDADVAHCEAAGVDVIFVPAADEIYSEGDQYEEIIPPTSLTHRHCGIFRPGHFVGVAMVVYRLFNIVEPDVAVFGEKDAQQLAVIRWLVQAYNLPVKVVSHPVVREEDGLALSSRNVYLDSPEKRQAALVLPKLLNKACYLFNLEEVTDFQVLKNHLLQDLQTEGSGFELEYFDAVSEETFLPVTHVDQQTRFLAAGRVGSVRLIDTMRVEEARGESNKFGHAEDGGAEGKRF